MGHETAAKYAIIAVLTVIAARRVCDVQLCIEDERGGGVYETMDHFVCRRLDVSIWICRVDKCLPWARVVAGRTKNVYAWKN